MLWLLVDVLEAVGELHGGMSRCTHPAPRSAPLPAPMLTLILRNIPLLLPVLLVSYWSR